MYDSRMKTKSKKIDDIIRHRKAISPILAVVILLGITVVAGGIVFSLFSTSATTASSADVIQIQNIQAVKGTSHADFTATVKNAGGQPWTKLEMTVSKSELSEPLIYESLHEVVAGCDISDNTAVTDGKCDGTPEFGGSEGKPEDNRDNPMRAQWLITLDKASGNAEDVADKGEGAAVGRKLVFDDKDDLRTIQILEGTAVSVLFGGTDKDGNTFASGYAGNILAADACTGAQAASGATYVDCTNTFKILDPSTKGEFECQGSTDVDVTAVCKVFTHQNLENEQIGTGQSRYFYADVLTQEIDGLNNQIARVGDNLVVNITAENADGGNTRVQSIIKVTGI